MPRKLKTIYELLSPYSEDEINQMLTKLTNDDLELIKKRYGEDLKNPKTSSEWNENISKKFYSLVSRMRFLLQNKPKIRKKTLYTLLKEYTKYEVYYMLTLLNHDELELIILKYGTDLENPVKSSEWNEVCDYKFYGLLLPRMRRLLYLIRGTKMEELHIEEEKKQEQDSIVYELPILDIYHEDEMIKIKKELEFVSYQELMEVFDIREINVILLYLMHNYSLNNISNIFQIEEKEVINIMKDNLPKLISFLSVRNSKTDLIRKK